MGAYSFFMLRTLIARARGDHDATLASALTHRRRKNRPLPLPEEEVERILGRHP